MFNFFNWLSNRNQPEIEPDPDMVEEWIEGIQTHAGTLLCVGYDGDNVWTATPEHRRELECDALWLSEDAIPLQDKIESELNNHLGSKTLAFKVEVDGKGYLEIALDSRD